MPQLLRTPSVTPRSEPAVSDPWVLMHVTTVPMSLSFLRGQVEYMTARGFHVHAISSPGEELIAFGERHVVNVHAVEMTRSIAPASDLLAVWKIVSLLRRVRPTIVHAHTPKGGLLAMIAARLAGVPVRVYHMRGLPLMGASGPRRVLLRLTEWVSCRLAHSVLCNSRSIRAIAIKEGICDQGRISVILKGSGQGVDASGRFNPLRVDTDLRDETRRRLGIPGEATVLGYVGRLVRDKGIVELADAWLRLRDEYPSLHLLLVGPFEPQDPIPGETRRLLEEDPRIHLTGMDWNTPPLYAIMDVLVLPTYREGFPNVLLEAAAMQLPVVATDVPGCVDAVEDGVTGVLVPAKNAEALSEAMSRYLDRPALRRQHGEAARRRVLRDFRQEDIWNAIYQEYERLLEPIP